MSGGGRWLVAFGVVAWALLDRLFPEGRGVAAPWGGAVFAVGVVASRALWPGARVFAHLAAGLVPTAIALGLPFLLRGPGGASPQGGLWLLPWGVLALLLASDRRACVRLLRLVPVEAKKTRRSTLFRVAFVASALATLAVAVTQTRLPQTSGWSLLAGSLGSGFFVADVFLLVLGATAVSGEATAGTLKMMLPHAYARADWIVAKGAVIVLTAVVLGLVVSSVGLVHGAAAEGLGDVVRAGEVDPLFPDDPVEDEVLQTGGTMARYAQARILSGVGALATTGLMGLLLSAITESVVASLCGAFLVYAGMKSAALLFRVPEAAQQLLYGWYPDRIGELLDTLGRGFSEGWSDALLPAGLSLDLTASALFLLLGILTFRRADIHA